MKMNVENMMECRLARETEVLGENLRSDTFVHRKIPCAHPGLNPGRRRGTPATNPRSDGAAFVQHVASRYTDYVITAHE
jgi:hypothetical protein